MSKIGIVEGFFGPAWSQEARMSFAPFLKNYGGDFYFYAPKRDAYLRKSWRENWSEDYLNQLAQLRNTFHQYQLKFGIGLSPFNLGSEVSPTDWEHLKRRFQILSELKIDYLGLFFDDMPSTDKLLDVQSQVAQLALNFFPDQLIFCPSYYSYDPILDKVFGPRPEGYVGGLRRALAPEVEICWTGPKVISEEITFSHLEEVANILGRKPFIWENLFANDGPRNCKFLKLKYFNGRDESLLTQTQGVGFNLMNQPYISQLVYLSALWKITLKLSSQEAFEKSCYELCSPELANFIISNRIEFLEKGLDSFSQAQKDDWQDKLSFDSSPIAEEIKSWLNQEYLVGPECLTD